MQSCGVHVVLSLFNAQSEWEALRSSWARVTGLARVEGLAPAGPSGSADPIEEEHCPWMFDDQ